MSNSIGSISAIGNLQGSSLIAHPQSISTPAITDQNKALAPQLLDKDAGRNEHHPNKLTDKIMNTQDFLILRAQSQDEPFKILDEVIAKMKENMEEAGKALEALVEMIKKTSKSAIGLQLLEKTLEAMDEMTGKNENKTL